MADLLYEVTLLERQIQELTAEYPELAEDEDFRRDVLEGETGTFMILSRVICAALDAKSMAGAIKARAAEVSSRGARYERLEAAMRKLAHRIMVAADLPKATLPEATLSITKGRDSVEITDENALPAWAFKIVRQPSKTDLKVALDAGMVVPGAAIKTGDETLTVRTA